MFDAVSALGTISHARKQRLRACLWLEQRAASRRLPWVPAFAGMTVQLDRNPLLRFAQIVIIGPVPVIPAIIANLRIALSA
jgi:hypothetical protein